jgi:hypothetical protein
VASGIGTSLCVLRAVAIALETASLAGSGVVVDVTGPPADAVLAGSAGFAGFAGAGLAGAADVGVPGELNGLEGVEGFESAPPEGLAGLVGLAAGVVGLPEVGGAAAATARFPDIKAKQIPVVALIDTSLDTRLNGLPPTGSSRICCKFSPCSCTAWRR